MEKNAEPDSKKISAVAFDLDGTLYPNYRLYIQLFPFLIKEQKFLRAFGKARDRLRQEAPHSIGLYKDPGGLRFYQRQAQYMGEILKEDPAYLALKTERFVYRGWEPHFKKVKLYSHVSETLRRLRDRGIKLGLLSDFPPGKKIENLGLSGLWDTMLCSEIIGWLKPDPRAFLELARTMELPPEEILYVGNSYSYDVLGARKAGMKAAWIRPMARFLGLLPGKKDKADFIFYDYRQLYNYVLN